MLAKNSSNVWNYKRNPVQTKHRHKPEWPQLGKQENLSVEDKNKNWPSLDKSSSIAGNNTNGNQVGKSDFQVHQSTVDKPVVDAAQPTVIVIGQQKSFHNKGDVESVNPQRNKPVNILSQSLPLETNQKPPSGDSENLAVSNKEKKKLAFKKLSRERKEALKKDKQRRKEEITLQKMVGPKGVKVTLIDTNVFSSICETSNNVQISQSKSFNGGDVQLDSTAFPELQRSSKKSHIKGFDAGFKKSFNLGSPVSECSNKTHLITGSSDANPSRSSKSRRKRDPVVVDILKAIEICNTEKQAAEGEGFLVTRKKEKERCKIAGNVLDSSNPMRHRGKKREVPKKHCGTRIKKLIMAERRRRKEAKCVPKLEVGNATSANAKDDNIQVAVAVDAAKAEGRNGPVEGTVELELLGKVMVKAEEEGTSNCMEKHLSECSGNMLNTPDLNGMAKNALHSRKFREYCNHFRSTDLTEHVKLLLKDIIKFQDRMHANQPIKAEAHRRYVVGLRQTEKLLAVHKIKLVVMATDLEKVPSPGGLDDAVNTVIESANKQNVPVVFPLTRRELGKVTYRKVGVSCVGIINYQGSEENVHKVTAALEDSKKDYQDKLEKVKLQIMSEFGLETLKKEDIDEENKDDVQLTAVEDAVTLPLLKKLTEAISEMSVVSPSLKIAKDEL